MACYLVADMRITDQELFAEFAEAVPATVQQYGGTYLIRGGKLEVAQGDLTPKPPGRDRVRKHGPGEGLVRLSGVRRPRADTGSLQQVQFRLRRRRVDPQ